MLVRLADHSYVKSMRYDELRQSDDAEFRRYHGMPRATFDAMVEV